MWYIYIYHIYDVIYIYVCVIYIYVCDTYYIYMCVCDTYYIYIYTYIYHNIYIYVIHIIYIYIYIFICVWYIYIYHICVYMCLHNLCIYKNMIKYVLIIYCMQIVICETLWNPLARSLKIPKDRSISVLSSHVLQDFLFAFAQSHHLCLSFFQRVQEGLHRLGHRWKELETHDTWWQM